MKGETTMYYTLGVDLGGTNTAAGIITEEGTLLGQASVPTRQTDPDSVLAGIVSASKQAMQKTGISKKDLHAVGIGIPGLIASSKGPVIFAPNVGWKNTNPVPDLEKVFGVPVILGNDGACAALGEAVGGSGRQYRNIVMLTLGTAVGGGVVFDGTLFQGFGAFGGELGHIPLKRRGAAPCSCGRRGCFQQYASGFALIWQTRKVAQAHHESLIWDLCGQDLDQIDGRTAFRAAAMGDPMGKGIVERYIEDLSEGISGLINIFRPDAFVIGGGVSNEGDPLFVPLNQKVSGLCYASELIGSPPVIPAVLGSSAGILGAGLLPLRSGSAADTSEL